MKKTLLLSFIFFNLISPSFAQDHRRPPRHHDREGFDHHPPRGHHGRGRGPRSREIGESPAELGSSAIVWYPILEDGLEEAKRSNRPIFFMAAASQCHGISGVF